MNTSIIIPAYKSYWIEDCLDSVQQNNPDEILVGIDGCTKTLKILQKIQHKYDNLSIFWFKNRHPPGITRSTLAFKEASNDYLMFVDSDNLIKETLIQDTENVYEPKDFFIYGTAIIWDEYDWSLRPYFPCLGMVYISKQDFMDVGGYSDMVTGEDCELIERLCLLGYNKQYLKNTYILHRIHENSITKRKEKQSYNGWRTDVFNNNWRRQKVNKIKPNFEDYEVI